MSLPGVRDSPSLLRSQSACAVSNRVARCAGTKFAKSAMAARMSGMPTNVAGSQDHVRILRMEDDAPKLCKLSIWLILTTWEPSARKIVRH